MNTDHRTVVLAPSWALQALRGRHLNAKQPFKEAAVLPGLEVVACPFEAWLKAGGERRLKPRPLPSDPLNH